MVVTSLRLLLITLSPQFAGYSRAFLRRGAAAHPQHELLRAGRHLPLRAHQHNHRPRAGRPGPQPDAERESEKIVFNELVLLCLLFLGSSS